MWVSSEGDFYVVEDEQFTARRHRFNLFYQKTIIINKIKSNPNTQNKINSNSKTLVQTKSNPYFVFITKFKKKKKKKITNNSLGSLMLVSDWLTGGWWSNTPMIPLSISFFCFFIVTYTHLPILWLNDSVSFYFYMVKQCLSLSHKV